MSHTPRPPWNRLADGLLELKQRTGRTYDGLAARTGVSSSSLQRYSTGASAPMEFGVVERIGKVCGATRTELVTLHTLWLRESAKRRPAGDQPSDLVAASTVEQPQPEASSNINRHTSLPERIAAVIARVGRRAH
jgi:hypothetical protein